MFAEIVAHQSIARFVASLSCGSHYGAFLYHEGLHHFENVSEAFLTAVYYIELLDLSHLEVLAGAMLRSHIELEEAFSHFVSLFSSIIIETLEFEREEG